jgi:Ca-activated chloride channel family protein
LVRVGLKARETANSEADTGEAPFRPVRIANEVKIEVKFNPAQVASYHLIGYEQQMPGKEGSNRDEVDMGEIEAGQTVTAFFEVVPVGANENPAAVVLPGDSRKNSTQESNEMLTAKLRYKKPNDGKSELIQQSAVDDGKQFASASPDFKFAAAVAEFGMLLRESEFKGNGTLGAVLEWAQASERQ